MTNVLIEFSCYICDIYLYGISANSQLGQS